MKTKLLQKTFLSVALISFSLFEASAQDFTFDSNVEGWAANGTTATIQQIAGTAPNTGVLEITPGSGEIPALTTTAIDADTNKFLRIVIKNNSSATQMRLNVDGGDGTGNINSPITANSTVFETIDIDLSAEAKWNSNNLVVIQFRQGTNPVTGVIEIDAMLFTSTVLSVKGNSLEGVSVYPNPAKDFLRINTLQVVDVKLFNILGALVMSENEVSRELTMNVSNLNGGIYLLRIEAENKFFTQKIIVD